MKVVGTTLKAFSLILLFAMVATQWGCSRARKYEDVPMDVSWQRIMEKYDRGRYLDAADRLELFLINYAGSALADSAQYMLGECHFNMKEYIISANEYQKVFLQYPQSSLAPDAEYKMGLSYFKLSPKYSLDQEYTQKAIDTFQLFIEDYPNASLVDDATKRIGELREKLAHKEFFNGLLYQKMKEYPSARIYFDLVLNDYYDTPYAARAQYYKAKSFEREQEWEKAIEAYTAFLNKFGDNELAPEALRSLNHSRDKFEESKTPKKKRNFILPIEGVDDEDAPIGS